MNSCSRIFCKHANLESNDRVKEALKTLFPAGMGSLMNNLKTVVALVGGL
jgi:hypothetical protein